MSKPKIVVEPARAVNGPAPETPTEKAVEEKPKRTVGFVKNFNPHEKIIFEDGTPHCFYGHLFVTSDQELIKKIAGVMDRYEIITQERKTSRELLQEYEQAK